MGPNALNFLIGLLSGVTANAITTGAKAAFQHALDARPDLERRLAAPTSPVDLYDALGELSGTLEILADNGTISIDGAVISALRSARIDHQNGKVQIGNTVVSAKILETGGTGAGSTNIGSNSELLSAETSIKLGDGASIMITGNAGIKQN